MALDYKGTVVLLGANLIPSGYTVPSVETFTDAEYNSELILSVLKSTVEDANPAVTLVNIINDGTIGIEKQVSDILEGDMDVTSNTVEAYVELISITNNVQANLNGDFYGNVPVSYSCKVRVRAKAY